MKASNCENYLCSVEFRNAFFEIFFVLKLVVKVTTPHKVHYKIESL